MGIAAGPPSRPLATRRGLAAGAVSEVLAPALTPAIAEETLDIVLQHLVDGVTDLVPGTRGAGVIAAVDDHELVRAATDGAVRRLLQTELDAGDGPTLAAIAARRSVEVDLADLCVRWPRLAAPAEAAGVASVLVIPLRTDHLALGAFALLCGGTGLDDHGRAIADTLARAALLAVERNHHEHHTRRALESRSLIGSAIGILMERYDLTAPAAWEHLRRLASEEERKLRDVAAGIVGDRSAVAEQER